MTTQTQTPPSRFFPAPPVPAQHSGERMLPRDLHVGTHLRVRPKKDRHIGLSLLFSLTPIISSDIFNKNNNILYGNQGLQDGKHKARSN